jgi:putative transposase
MARANRHYIPGCIWHITHRCHNRDFLFRKNADRRIWIQWLFEAKERHYFSILNYSVTANHIHLLIFDESGRREISSAMQLIQGRTGQTYNHRNNRKGAFWEDRYHATAVESGTHLMNCMIYIDFNMVRAGAVDHPGQWNHCGYHEIIQPRRKKQLIAYKALRKLAGFEDYTLFKKIYRSMIEERFNLKDYKRENKWTEGIAVGSEGFVRAFKNHIQRPSNRKVLFMNDCFLLK